MKKTVAVLFAALFAGNVNADTSFGAGLGIPYGGLGFNLSHAVNDSVDLSASMGTSLLSGVATSFGARYYPNRSESSLKFGAYYGTVGVVETSFEDYETFDGLSLSVGWGAKGHSSGWDFDLVYIASSDIDDLTAQGYVAEQGGDLKLSFGYRWKIK